MLGGELLEQDIAAYLEQHLHQGLLRFITCGSVDDGKSTLIGRLLYDSKLIYEDQLALLEADSKRVGTQGQNIDFALLVDGLAAEREQGITIDVAYRFFSTQRRKFIVADTPGHEQYTRNMVTGASTADLAVILIDARQGILTQTRRHSYLVHLLGIRQIVLAINKMDLVDYDQARFDTIVADYRAIRRHRRHQRLAGSADIGTGRRQHLVALGTDALVSRSRAARASRERADRCRCSPGAAVPDAGAVGQPAEPGISRLRRPDQFRQLVCGRSMSAYCPPAGAPASAGS